MKPRRALLPWILCAAGVLLPAACIGRPPAAPMDVAKITSVQRYKAHTDDTLQTGGQPAVSISADLAVAGPSRLRSATTQRSVEQTVSGQMIAIDGSAWLNTGSGWTEMALTVSPQDITMLSAPFLQLFANLKGKMDDYHGEWADHYQGTLQTSADLDSAIYSSLKDAQVMGLDAGSPSDITASVEYFDLWVRASDQAPLAETVWLTITIQGQTGHIAESTMFSDINGADIDVEPPTMS